MSTSTPSLMSGASSDSWAMNSAIVVGAARRPSFADRQMELTPFLRQQRRMTHRQSLRPRLRGRAGDPPRIAG